MSNIVPEMQAAFFKCGNCEHEDRVLLENAKVKLPNRCNWCKSRDTFELIHNRCNFTNKQYVKLQ